LSVFAQQVNRYVAVVVRKASQSVLMFVVTLNVIGQKLYFNGDLVTVRALSDVVSGAL
jgi:hypothetical protein